jgi:lipoprotein-anchoring transpeptidase ErfK/SrfK
VVRSTAPSPLAHRARALVVGSTAIVAGALALSGCSVGQLGIHAGTTVAESAAAIRIAPSPTAKALPDKPVVVTVASGRLTGVVVSGPGGVAVPGSLSLDGRTWTSQAGSLDYGSAYTVSAQAVDRQGLPAHARATLHTVAPTTFLGLTVTPVQGANVGVGMPVVVTLDHQLRRGSSRAALERSLAVTVDGRAVVGGWYWTSSSVLEYRPEVYWPGHATIVVTAALKGVRFQNGLWGEQDVSTSFHTGAAMVSYVDMRSDHMRVTRDGKTVRVIPITTGKPGFETRSGIKVIMSKERTRIMDAATGGTAKNDPEYYRLTVEYAMRLTYSGEFLHAAPWSVAHQGSSNVSHGCTGMSTSNAAWLYANSEPGDVVVYTGNDKPMNAGNGITVWNVPWSAWRSHSALSA